MSENIRREWTCNHRLTLVVGHYGSGKTEFALNLAFALAARGAGEGKPVALADLDVVNPYFRSRERRLLLEQRGIMLIASSQACADADLPSMPATLNALLQTDRMRGVLDIGGNSGGARVLARYQRTIRAQDHQMLMVLNANRPQTRTAQQAAQFMTDIAEVTGLTITGLVNNTHLCGETTQADILRGAALAAQVSQLTGVPVACHVAKQELTQGLETDAPIFPIRIYMNKPWEETAE